MTAYYNEIEPYAADWLENLIREKLIAPGIVDRRSIVDVRPADLDGFVQCHFFAGIGGWSYALRLAGWADTRPVWTGSCPCQPFSAAGKGGGFDDERHLWPAFHHLISQCRPGVVVGEQVASKDGLAWWDLVQADLEGAGYASGALDFCSAGVGAPHIRQRLYWVGERLADADSGQRGWFADGEGCEPNGAPSRRDESDGIAECGIAAVGLEHGPSDGRIEWWPEPGGRGAPSGCGTGRLDHHHQPRLEGQRSGYQAEGGRIGEVRPVAAAGQSGGLGVADGTGPFERRATASPNRHGHPALATSGGLRPGPTNGHWRDPDWLFCRDGKWRPVEPGTFPLAHGAPARVGRLRAYGNAINAQAAQIFIESFMECRP